MWQHIFEISALCSRNRRTCVVTFTCCWMAFSTTLGFKIGFGDKELCKPIFSSPKNISAFAFDKAATSGLFFKRPRKCHRKIAFYDGAVWDSSSSKRPFLTLFEHIDAPRNRRRH